MKQEKMVGGVLIAVVVVAAGVLIWKGQEKQSVKEEAEVAGTVTTPGTTADSTAGGTGTTATYAQVLKIYQTSGYRFQFVGCNATPGALVVKKGSKYMLDNHNNEAHKIMVGSTVYQLKKDGYAIATASTIGKYKITCDGGGSADLTIAL